MKKLQSLFVLAVVVLSACNTQKPDFEGTFTDNFELYPNVLTGNSRSDTTDESALAKVMAYYEQQKFQEALPAFDEYLSHNPDYYKAMFYRGLTNLKLKNLDDAIYDLEMVVKNETEFKDQAEWYLSLAYIRAGEKEKAVSLLQDMQAHSPSQGEKAAHLLSKVNQWPG